MFRRIPPYTNALPQDPVRASKIPVQRSSFVKTVPRGTSEKVTVTAESAVTSLQTPANKTLLTGEVKKLQNTQPIRTNVSQTITKPGKMIINDYVVVRRSYVLTFDYFLVDKAVVSSTTSADESKPSIGSESEYKVSCRQYY